MNSAYGFLEVRGLVAGIECADVMLKAASVRLATQITTNPALITLIVDGDIGSCRAAIDAGRLAAERLGAMVSEKVIGRPEPDLALFVNTRQRWKTPAVQPSGNENGSVLARVAMSPEVPEMLPVDHARGAADLGSDPNSADISHMDAQPTPELDPDPNSADPATERLTPSQPEPENANLQPASTSPVTDPLGVLINYLKSAPSGKRLDQIAQVLKLPETDAQTLLNFALEQDRLKKLGSRYMIP
jgi:microcompartment protein CcmL/EutN